MKRATIITFAAAVALAAAFLTGNSIANSQSRGPANNIATVNIQGVFDALQERKDKLLLLQAEANKLEDEFKIISAGINRDRDAAGKLPDGPQRDAALEAVVDRDVQANIDIKKAKARLEKAQASTIKLIFDKIQAEAKLMAAKNGYTMVMAADDWVQISPRATSQEATQLMSLRRFLYVDNKQHDITVDLTNAINSAYAASKPPAPAPAAPAAPAAGTPAAPR